MLKAGDILFFNRGNPNNKWYHKVFTCLQKKLDEGVIHVEIVVEELEDGRVLTLGSNADGTKYRFQIWNHRNVAVKTFKYDIENFDDIILKTYLNLKDDGETKYDYKGLLNATINQVMEKLTLSYWKKKNIFRNKENTFCSKFVIRCYKNAGITLNRKGEDTLSENCTPGDIYKAYDFKFVKCFGEKIEKM